MSLIYCTFIDTVDCKFISAITFDIICEINGEKLTIYNKIFTIELNIIHKYR